MRPWACSHGRRPGPCLGGGGGGGGASHGERGPLSWEQACWRQAETEAETRLSEEPHDVPAPSERLREQCKCLRTLPSAATQKPAVSLTRSGATILERGGRESFWQREIRDHCQTLRSGRWVVGRAGLWLPTVGWLNTPCSLRLGEDLGCTYPSRGQRGQGRGRTTHPS